MTREHREALVVGHPGHELRVDGWLTLAKPLTFVMTDGSGPTGAGRFASTEAILRDAGAIRGSVFGAMTDRAAYDAILSGDVALFRGLSDAIAAELVEHDITSVAGDGWEGYNPVHDACRLVIDAAVALASQRSGRAIENWSFPLVGRPDFASPGEETRFFVLDDAAFARKLEKAARYRELAADVEWAFAEYGRDAFRTEVLTRIPRPAWDDARFLHERPFYEEHGEARVREGKYAELIRYRDHVVPIAEGLRELAALRSPCASF
ncbi:MAG: hypothetical protein WC538_19890 [Thermoanaerobaculia bacterium]|jgi:hypothetical protein